MNESFSTFDKTILRLVSTSGVNMKFLCHTDFKISNVKEHALTKMAALKIAFGVHQKPTRINKAYIHASELTMRPETGKSTSCVYQL